MRSTLYSIATESSIQNRTPIPFTVMIQPLAQIEPDEVEIELYIFKKKKKSLEMGVN